MTLVINNATYFTLRMIVESICEFSIRLKILTNNHILLQKLIF